MVHASGSKGAGRYLSAIGLAFILCAAAPLEKAPAGKPAQHGAQDTGKGAAQAEEKHQAAPPPAPTSEKAQPPAAKATPDHHGPEHDGERANWTDKAQALTAIAVAIFTAFLSWLSWRQHKLEERLAADTGESLAIAKQSADAATRTAATMEETAERQLRAYIFVTKGRVAYRDGQFEARLTIGNSGQTPAYNLRQVGAMRVTDEPAAITFETTDDTGQRMIVPPREETHFVIFLDPARYPPTGGDARTMYVVGELTYTDAFRRDRYTRFRCTVIGDVMQGLGRLRPCDDGNDAN